jgi:uncharacterized membrane protein
MFKRTSVWLLVVISLVGVVISYWGIYVLAAYFAAGLVWWASLSLLISGPIGATGAIIGWRSPRQRIAFALGLLSFGAWLLLWSLLLFVMIRAR